MSRGGKANNLHTIGSVNPFTFGMTVGGSKAQPTIDYGTFDGNR